MTKVYTLKRATPKMKYRHMRDMMEFKRELKEHQMEESERRYQEEGIEVCQQIRDMLTQAEYDAWWDAAPEQGFFEAAHRKLIQLQEAIAFQAKPADYNGKAVPDKPCPKCGGILRVCQHKRYLNSGGDDITLFVGCSNYFTNGCRHKEKFTAAVMTAIDSVPVEPDVEF